MAFGPKSRGAGPLAGLGGLLCARMRPGGAAGRARQWPVVGLLRAREGGWAGLLERRRGSANRCAAATGRRERSAAVARLIGGEGLETSGKVLRGSNYMERGTRPAR